MRGHAQLYRWLNEKCPKLNRHHDDSTLSGVNVTKLPNLFHGYAGFADAHLCDNLADVIVEVLRTVANTHCVELRRRRHS